MRKIIERLEELEKRTDYIAPTVRQVFWTAKDGYFTDLTRPTKSGTELELEQARADRNGIELVLVQFVSPGEIAPEVEV